MSNPATATASPDERARVFNKAFSKDLQRLKERDNSSNISYLVANYALFIATVALTIWSYTVAETSGLGYWLSVPTTVIAVIIIGGFQHQLGGGVHEATHYTLFANRKANEVVSDWLCAFPIYTTTYAFRIHHLAHHQFVNDPVRDPNFAQAEMSGHWLDFPLSQFELLMGVIRQLNPVRLVMYIAARARYSAIGSDRNPYANPDRMGSPWAIRWGALYAVAMPAVACHFILSEQWTAVLVSHLVITGAILAYYALAPDSSYPQSRINPVISHRVTTTSRMAYLGIVYGVLSAICYATGAPAWGYFLLLWILPLFSTFSLFMIAREWFQHGNADRGRLTNSRVFHVNAIWRYLIFPAGMEYHLPHHIYCSVPHYKLRELHDVLSQDPEYKDKGIVVEGMLGQGAPGRPSVVEVLGPRYTCKSEEISVVDETLELADVNDPAGVARQSAASKKGLGAC